MAALFLATAAVLIIGILTPVQQKKADEPTQQAQKSEEMRAVWFSYLDLQPMMQGKSEQQFEQEIQAAFDDCVQLGCNRVFVQVRPFADAIYPSNYFPTSYLFTGVEGDELPYDALKIMVQAAHERNLAIEAWINPYRIRTNADVPISKQSPANTLDGEAVKEFGGGVYLNPASEEAKELIVNGVQEIVQNYAVDGIHFDDYFYPSGVDESFDKELYTAYQSSGGDMSLLDWRTQQVSDLVKRVYQTVKKCNSQVVFGISPQGNVDNDINGAVDVITWGQTEGYVDYLCPQIYWGDAYPGQSGLYTQRLNQWAQLVSCNSVKLYIGLAAYRVGDTSTGFANPGQDLANQVSAARQMENYGGFALFSYRFLVADNQVMQQELSGLKSLF